MGHHIKAIILKGNYSDEIAKKFDLVPVMLNYDNLTMFHISNEYSIYWQYKLGLSKYIQMNKAEDCYLPSEFSIPYIVCQLSLETCVNYAIIETDYFGGIGCQSAIYFNEETTDGKIIRINDVLRLLGVEAQPKLDEFDTVGLSGYRSTPDYLDKYCDFINELVL